MGSPVRSVESREAGYLVELRAEEALRWRRPVAVFASDAIAVEVDDKDRASVHGIGVRVLNDNAPRPTAWQPGRRSRVESR